MSDVVFPEAGPSSSPDRPSLFELLADEQLRDLFHPVIHYILSYLTQRYPRHLVKVLHHHEEVYALLLLLLEQHHLRKHNASVSEHFYQLQLTPRDTIPTPRLDMVQPRGRKRMTRRQRWGMLIFLVGLPYVRTKAQQYFERLRGNEQDETGLPITDVPVLGAGQRAFKLLYPYVNLGLDLTLLGYDIAYLFDKTDNYRPWHRWLGLQIQRKNPDDMPAPNPNPSLMSRLPPLLPPLLLLLKLSQWWYSPASPRSLPVPQTSATNHHLIPPPKPLPILPTADIYPLVPVSDNSDDDEQESLRYEIGPKDYGKCPLCRRKWQNPAILESGWVVCWRCGWDALHIDDEDERESGGNGKGRCPITGVEVSRNDLRRVLL